MFYCIFDQVNVDLISIRDLFQNINAFGIPFIIYVWNEQLDIKT